MATTRYSKWTGIPWGDVSVEDLLEELADYFLQSGFYSPHYDPEEGRSLEELYAAILQALVQKGHVDVQDFERWLENPEFQEQSEISELLKGLLQRLIEEGYITWQRPGRAEDDLDIRGYVGGFGPETDNVRFEITNKALDFLGYKTLKDLLSSLGKSDFGRHDTQELSTGIEAALPPKPYEFGDTLNLDVTATLLNAIERQGLSVPIEVEHRDLVVRQSEYQSSCSTVLLLDCSHSMILYGEDRFTPAKRVALALSHLIRSQYPGDSLHIVLFHDSAEEIPLGRLARVTIGPYHTNTKAGLRLAQQILGRERKDMPTRTPWGLTPGSSTRPSARSSNAAGPGSSLTLSCSPGTTTSWASSRRLPRSPGERRTSPPLTRWASICSWITCPKKSATSTNSSTPSLTIQLPYREGSSLVGLKNRQQLGSGLIRCAARCCGYERLPLMRPSNDRLQSIEVEILWASWTVRRNPFDCLATRSCGADPGRRETMTSCSDPRERSLNPSANSRSEPVSQDVDFGIQPGSGQLAQAHGLRSRSVAVH